MTSDLDTPPAQTLGLLDLSGKCDSSLKPLFKVNRPARAGLASKPQPNSSIRKLLLKHIFLYFKSLPNSHCIQSDHCLGCVS